MHFLPSVRTLIFIAFLTLIEFILAPFFPPANGRIDLYYLLILDHAFFAESGEAPFFAAFLGFLRDLASPGVPGVQMASLAAGGFLLYLGARKVESANPAVRLLLTAAFVLTAEFLNFSIDSLVQGGGFLTGEAAKGIALTALYAAALSPVFFQISNRWYQRTAFFKQYELF